LCYGSSNAEGIERVKSEEYRSTWVWAELWLCVVGVLVLFGLSKVNHGEWWRGLPPLVRGMAEGIGLAGFGITFLWLKWRAGRLRPRSPWEFRNLLFDVALLIGGAARLVEVLRDR
jgi:type VI protein secretion system component VasK